MEHREMILKLFDHLREAAHDENYYAMSMCRKALFEHTEVTDSFAVIVEDNLHQIEQVFYGRDIRETLSIFEELDYNAEVYYCNSYSG